MIQFIHTADIHFGMENYGKVDPATGIHTRLLDFVTALNACIDTAIKRDVDFFLFCGDAYKTAHPSQTQQRMLVQCFLRLHEANIPVIIIVGNHDHPLSFGKANALDLFGEFPLDAFHVISKPTTIHLQTKHGPINIVGIPWPTRNSISLTQVSSSSSSITDYISQAVVKIIKDHAQKLDPTVPAVLAGHLTVSNGIFSGSEKRAVYGTDPLFMPSQLAIEPFDYVALGHLHRHQNLNAHGTPIVYAGSIERVDFGERKEDKGFCLVSIDKKSNAQYQFIKVPMRPFIQIDATLNGEQEQTEQLIAAIQKYDVTNAIVKILYHLPDGQKDLVDLKAIQQACDAAMDLVGIIPIRTIAPRKKRLQSMNVSMDTRSLLETYFDTKTELKGRKEILLDKTMALLDEEVDEG